MSVAVKLKIFRRINVFITAGISSAYLYKKFTNLDNLKQTMKLQIDNRDVALPESLKNLLTELHNDMKPEQREQYTYHFFISKGVDLIQFGTPNTKTGAFIGIPYNFVFDKASDIDVNAMMDEGTAPINQEDLNSLQKSMCLSKEAKKFALAHEICKSQHSLFFSCGVVPLLVALNFNFVSYILERTTRKEKIPANVLNHVIILLSGAVFYFLIFNSLSVSREASSDFMASQMGSSYVRGGVEFYEKMIARNKILKKIQKGAPFTEDGDIKMSPIGKNHLSLSKRLIKLKDIESGNVQTNLFTSFFN